MHVYIAQLLVLGPVSRVNFAARHPVNLLVVSLLLLWGWWWRGWLLLNGGLHANGLDGRVLDAGLGEVVAVVGRGDRRHLAHLLQVWRLIGRMQVDCLVLESLTFN